MCAQRVTLTRVRVTHFTHYHIYNYNFRIYCLFLSENCIGLHSVINILVDFKQMFPGIESRGSHEFFFYYFFYFFLCVFCHYYYSANLQIQHYCLYSDSSTFITPYDAQASSAFSALVLNVRLHIGLVLSLYADFMQLKRTKRHKLVL